MQRNISIQHPNRSFLETTRIDNWWVGPLLTSIGLLAFIFYSTWAAFQNEHYQWGPYLSPFLCSPAWIRMVASFTGISYSLGSRRLQAHLLLLPESLLPCVFLHSTGLCGRREAPEISCRTISTAISEFASLLPLHRSHFLCNIKLRCNCFVLFWKRIRWRRWNSGLVWVVFKLFFRFPVQLFAIKNFVKRVLAIWRFDLTIKQFRTKLI